MFTCFDKTVADVSLKHPEPIISNPRVRCHAFNSAAFTCLHVTVHVQMSKVTVAMCLMTNYRRLFDCGCFLCAHKSCRTNIVEATDAGKQNKADAAEAVFSLSIHLLEGRM